MHSLKVGVFLNIQHWLLNLIGGCSHKCMSIFFSWQSKHENVTFNLKFCYKAIAQFFIVFNEKCFLSLPYFHTYSFLQTFLIHLSKPSGFRLSISSAGCFIWILRIYWVSLLYLPLALCTSQSWDIFIKILSFRLELMLILFFALVLS